MDILIYDPYDFLQDYYASICKQLEKNLCTPVRHVFCHNYDLFKDVKRYSYCLAIVNNRLDGGRYAIDIIKKINASHILVFASYPDLYGVKKLKDAGYTVMEKILDRMAADRLIEIISEYSCVTDCHNFNQNGTVCPLKEILTSKEYKASTPL